MSAFGGHSQIYYHPIKEDFLYITSPDFLRICFPIMLLPFCYLPFNENISPSLQISIYSHLWLLLLPRGINTFAVQLYTHREYFLQNCPFGTGIYCSSVYFQMEFMVVQHYLYTKSKSFLSVCHKCKFKEGRF